MILKKRKKLVLKIYRLISSWVAVFSRFNRMLWIASSTQHMHLHSVSRQHDMNLPEYYTEENQFTIAATRISLKFYPLM